jgi:hypothetical protein
MLSSEFLGMSNGKSSGRNCHYQVGGDKDKLVEFFIFYLHKFDYFDYFSSYSRYKFTK